jgi:DNA-binding IclR family transcriptional regulator
MALESVDNALRLLLLLADDDELGVTEAAHRLGIAPSTAHRLFTTLRDRGFVVQADNRSYRRGPALAGLTGRPYKTLDLVSIARPAMEELRSALDETCHLMVRDAREVRFLASVEAEQVLRVGSRAGAVLPAHQVSGGLVLLAELDGVEFAALYPASGVPDAGLDAAGVARLQRSLRTVRRRGYAVNNGQSEPGLAAIAMAVRDTEGSALGAISASVPTVRYYPARVPEIVRALQTASDAAGRALASAA